MTLSKAVHTYEPWVRRLSYDDVNSEARLHYLVKPCFERQEREVCDLTKQRETVPLGRI